MTTLGRRRTWLAAVALLAATASETSAEDAAIAEMEARVFAQVNAHRVSIGLPAEVPDAALKKWLGSEVHRKKIEGEYDLSGVGVAVSEDGTWYLTQLFVLR